MNSKKPKKLIDLLQDSKILKKALKMANKDQRNIMEKAKPINQEYNSHEHCFDNPKPPCGQRNKHYECCICQKLNPVSQTKECETSPNCSHNINGRNINKPCSIEFKPKAPTNWEEEEFAVKITDFLEGDLYFEGQEKLKGKKGLLISLKNFEGLLEFIRSAIKEAVRAENDRCTKICLEEGKTAIEEAYKLALEGIKAEKARIMKIIEGMKMFRRYY